MYKTMPNSNSNRFADFTAGASEGWFSTKKRGRDDEMIARDSSKAKAARKRKASGSSSSSSRPGRKTGGRAGSSRRQNRVDKELSGYNSMQEFLVSDGAEESEDGGFSDWKEEDADNASFEGEDEEEYKAAIATSSKRSTPTTEASSDESDYDTFLGSYPKRTSRATKPLRAAFDQSARAKPATKKMGKRLVKKRQQQQQKTEQARKSAMDEWSNSSDNDNDSRIPSSQDQLVDTPERPSNGRKTARERRQLSSKSSSMVDLFSQESDQDQDTRSSRSKQTATAADSAIDLVDSSDDEEFLAVLAASRSLSESQSSNKPISTDLARRDPTRNKAPSKPSAPMTISKRNTSGGQSRSKLKGTKPGKDWNLNSYGASSSKTKRDLEKSPYFASASASTSTATATTLLSDTSDDDDDDYDDGTEHNKGGVGVTKKKKSASSGKRLRTGSRQDSSETESINVELAVANAVAMSQATLESDDDVVVLTPPTRSTSKSRTSMSGCDWEDDDDGMKKTTKKKNTKKKKGSSQNIVWLDDIEDENDEARRMSEEEAESDNEATGEEYTENYKAMSVLDAANMLSAKVLSAMGNWSRQHSEQATKGMIVDGALALHDIGTATNLNNSWISQEIMQKVCPKVKLADYQLIGVNWLALLHGMQSDLREDGKPTNVNGVLADSMGLGKTVQTIVFLAWLKYNKTGITGSGDIETDAKPSKKRSRQRPHIVIVPASVLSNWENEFKKFCPHFRVIRYHGSQSERQSLRHRLRKYRHNEQSSESASSSEDQPDVILTTFSYFSTEKSDDRGFLRRFNFDYMVVDEAHCLKNPKGLRYKNMDKFSTSHRLLLTGTPIQNSPKELMSLLCFLMPLFSSASGKPWDNEHGNDGGERMLHYFVSMEGGKNASVSSEEAAYSKLKQLFAPFVLRRRKEDVMNQILPPKVRKNVRKNQGKQTPHSSLLLV